MKCFSALCTLFLAATAANALPGKLPTGDLDQIRFPVPDHVTVEQGSAKCGDQAQLSCCNKAKYSGNTTKASSGVAAGALNDILGGAAAAQGLGLFEQCSKLNIRVLISPGDILNQKCKQNIACCQQNPHEASNNLVGAALPCVALGSIL